MEDTYGMNREEVVQQIVALDDAAFKCWEDMHIAIGEFYNNLKEAWCSNRALEFSKKYIPQLFAAINNFRWSLCNICKSAVTSYNAVARSHDEPTISCNDIGYRDLVFGLEEPAENYSYMIFENDGSGETFLNINLARTAMDILIDGKKRFFSAAQSLPANISIYDPSGEIISSFKTKINSRVNDIVTLVESIIRELNDAFETEVTSVKYASNSAKEIIQSSNGSNVA